MKIEICPIDCSDGSMGYYWQVVAGNGKILAHSESYTTKASAKRTAYEVVLNFGSQIRRPPIIDLETGEEV